MEVSGEFYGILADTAFLSEPFVFPHVYYCLAFQVLSPPNPGVLLLSIFRLPLLSPDNSPVSLIIVSYHRDCNSFMTDLITS